MHVWTFLRDQKWRVHSMNRIKWTKPQYPRQPQDKSRKLKEFTEQLVYSIKKITFDKFCLQYFNKIVKKKCIKTCKKGKGEHINIILFCNLEVLITYWLTVQNPFFFSGNFTFNIDNIQSVNQTYLNWSCPISLKDDDKTHTCKCMLWINLWSLIRFI